MEEGEMKGRRKRRGREGGEEGREGRKRRREIKVDAVPVTRHQKLLLYKAAICPPSAVGPGYF